MPNHDLIVIGGSAGSFPVLQRIFRDLPADLPAAVLVCTHRPKDAADHRSELFSAGVSLRVNSPVDGQPLEQGHIYLAPSDRHLLVVDHTIRLGRGPRENMSRPAIDPLFRSAALSFGSRAVGVVLSGMMNDGASGLHAISETGGITVVQHPLDAEVADMPTAAMATVAVDHVVPSDQLGFLLGELARLPAGPPKPTELDLELEVKIALGNRMGPDKLSKVADPSMFSCPHCHGVLSHMKDNGPLRFRCQIGHGFTAENLLVAQEDEVHEALAVAMRVMEERLGIVERMAEDARAQGRDALAKVYDARAAEYRRYAQTLRQAVSTSMDTIRHP
ncbi:chemotaxis protein CheB [Geminicoccus flavidas]|uniref:chemotaxis protein CheB n=1 Tax=Geminicoccus flavidas TaxID=2506407 RepID=UPI00135C1650|nr:chemotaxis protein CheB [Geminicoccus flavidas]